MCVCVCGCVCVLTALVLLCPHRAEEGMPQRLLQGDAPVDVVLQHEAQQVEQLPLLFTLPLHELLRDESQEEHGHVCVGTAADWLIEVMRTFSGLQCFQMESPEELLSSQFSCWL